MNRNMIGIGAENEHRSSSSSASTGQSFFDDFDATNKGVPKNWMLFSGLADDVNELTPRQYIEAKRFLNQVNEVLTALGGPDVAKYFNGDYDPKGMSLGELVRHMTKNELLFAPALEGDEAAYLALHHAFVLYLEGVKAP